MEFQHATAYLDLRERIKRDCEHRTQRWPCSADETPNTTTSFFIFILFLFDAPLSTTNTDIHWNNYDLLLKMILLLLY